jgi:hypothetical protein
MKITKHISFYFVPERLIYINNILSETSKYKYITDIFIHTNNIDLTIENLNNYTNGKIEIIYHDLSGINPFFLTWKCRDLLQKQRQEYDIFIYIEDDILVPCKAIEYWLKYNEELIQNNYNLGFLRIEVDYKSEDKIEYITDLQGTKLDSVINLNGKTYCVNDKNPYCAFWIYNKDEFNKFVNSEYYDINNIEYYPNCIREKSAFGLHNRYTKWYKNTLIPIVNNKLIEECKIYHMPNNYIGSCEGFCSIKFNEALVV